MVNLTNNWKLEVFRQAGASKDELIILSERLR